MVGSFTSANNRMAFVSHMPKRHVAILFRCTKFARSEFIGGGRKNGASCAEEEKE
jgi:hypothetical protein